LFGPGAGAFANWWTSGGAMWVGEGLITVLDAIGVPTAKAVFDWISYVVEPVRAKALDIDHALKLASKKAYRLLLEEKGLVAPDAWTPESLRWENVREFVPTWGPPIKNDFEDYVLDVALFLGYGAFRSVQLGVGNSAVKLDGWNVKLQGVNTYGASAQSVAKALFTTLDTYRLKPYREALLSALEGAEKAISLATSVSPGWVEVGGEDEVSDEVQNLNDRIEDLDQRIQDECNLTSEQWSTHLESWREWYNSGDAANPNVWPGIVTKWSAWVTTWESWVNTNCPKIDVDIPPDVPPDRPPVSVPGPAGTTLTHRQARDILVQAWLATTGRNATLPELQIAQAIGRFEGRYGAKGNNWGGVQCKNLPPCPAGCWEYTDSHADGKKYQGCLRIYPTPEAGASGMLGELLRRPAVAEAMKRGDSYATAKAMRESHYHETAIDKYASAIQSNAADIASKLGEPLAVKGSGGSGNGGLIVGGLVLVGLALAGRRRKR